MAVKDNGVQTPSAGVADSDEQRVAHVAAQVDELHACEIRLAAAKNSGDADSTVIAQLEGRVADLKTALGRTADAGKPKAKRATKRTK